MQNQDPDFELFTTEASISICSADYINFFRTSSFNLVLVIYFACFLCWRFILGNDTRAFWKCMRPPCGMDSSLSTCSLKSRRCTCMPRGMVFEVRYLPTVEEKNQTKKKLKGKSFQWLLGKNSKRHNFTDTE